MFINLIMFKQMNKPLEKNHLFTFKSIRIPIIYALKKSGFYMAPSGYRSFNTIRHFTAGC